MKGIVPGKVQKRLLPLRKHALPFMRSTERVERAHLAGLLGREHLPFGRQGALERVLAIRQTWVHA